jgi:hypothetical protein
MTLRLDERSLLLTCSPETPLKSIEAALLVSGLTLGYLPAQPVMTLGEALERRVPNRLSEYYGEIDDLCVVVKASHKLGLIRTKNVPRSATGPDFKKLLVSSNGSTKILEVTLRVSPRPSAREQFKIQWKTESKLQEFLKYFWSAGIRPASLVKKNGKRLEIALMGLGEVVEAEAKEVKSLARRTQGVIHA